MSYLKKTVMTYVDTNVPKHLLLLFWGVSQDRFVSRKS